MSVCFGLPGMRRIGQWMVGSGGFGLWMVVGEGLIEGASWGGGFERVCALSCEVDGTNLHLGNMHFHQGPTWSFRACKVRMVDPMLVYHLLW